MAKQDNPGEIYDNLVREYTNLQDQQKQITDRLDEIKKVLRGLEPGTYPIAGVSVIIARSATLDADKFMARYPVLERPEFYKPSIDNTAVKRGLAPAEIEELQKLGEPRVTVK